MFCVRLSVGGLSALRNATPAVNPGAAHVISKMSSGSAKTPAPVDGEGKELNAHGRAPPKEVPAHHLPTNANNKIASSGFENKPGAAYNYFGHDRPNYPMGQTATASLHSDLPRAVFDDLDRKAPLATSDWRTNTDRRQRKADNNLSSYMALSTGGAVAMYMAKYALFGVVKLIGPSRDKYALGSIEIDISTIPEGKNAVFTFRGKPLFIRHRTQEEIDAAKNCDVASLRDPQTDEERVKNEKFLLCIGICTHLGCVPISHAGGWNGYFCPCHGSHYDTCGRIMKGPAPLNLEIPDYQYLEENVVLVGS